MHIVVTRTCPSFTKRYVLHVNITLNYIIITKMYLTFLVYITLLQVWTLYLFGFRCYNLF